MSTWGASTFQNDAALDFINMEIDRHVGAIEEIFSDELRFNLDVIEQRQRGRRIPQTRL